MGAYVRKKRVGHYEYYQLVESRRVDGEPRQKVLVHLGRHPTVEDALKKWPREIKRLRRLAREQREMVSEGHETTPAYRDILQQTERADKRANDLEANLKKLRELRKQGSL
jgi:hypothetical protein